MFGSLQFAYSLFFKYHSGYDLVVLASLYVFRAVIPATYEDVVLSQWFLVIFFAAALFLASGKRYAEYLHGGRDNTRTVLASYSDSQLMMWVGISLTLLISSYLNWIFIFSEEARFPFLLVSLIPMSIILIRLSFLTMSKNGEDPTKVIFRDKNNFLLGVIWLGLYLFGKGYL
jgi:decaprenyl-phosphate phosphoribosyltransferase